MSKHNGRDAVLAVIELRGSLASDLGRIARVIPERRDGQFADDAAECPGLLRRRAGAEPGAAKLMAFELRTPLVPAHAAIQGYKLQGLSKPPGFPLAQE